MSLFDPAELRPCQDNVLVRLDMHAKAQDGERRLASGLYVPKIADNGANAGTGEAVPATVIAVGPGRYTDAWRDQQKGSTPHGDGWWCPNAVQAGARVLVDSPLAGDRIVGRNAADEYRMVREENVIAYVLDDGDLRPLGDRILVAPVVEDEVLASGLVLPTAEGAKPTEGEVLAVGPGKYTIDDRGFVARRKMLFADGQRVLFGKFAGITVRLEGVELRMLREEDVLAVIGGDE